MSALAKILLCDGVKVSGSDVKESAITEELKRLGAVINIGHKAENLDDSCEEVVYSSAIARDNPELLKAKALGIPVTHRGALLAALFNEGKGIAVSGAHGKTTTSSMTAQILYKTQKSPNVVLGGILPAINSNAYKGESSLWAVEADESDGSFLLLNPARTIITNIEPEHMNYYRTVENLENSFFRFAHQSDELILCLDDKRTSELAAKLDKEYHTYGIDSPSAELTAENIIQNRLSCEADVIYKGEKVCRLELKVPGRHNVLNALAALYAAYLEGISFEDAAAALSDFHGTGRRFEVLYNGNGVVLADDYAHHPTEVKATIKAAKDAGFERVVAVFQPHRYSRVKELYKEFGKCFNDADVVIIDDIYSAWEEPIPGISSEMIVEEVKNEGVDALYFGSEEKIRRYLLDNYREGDILLLMGAGDIRKLSEQLAADLAAK